MIHQSVSLQYFCIRGFKLTGSTEVYEVGMNGLSVMFQFNTRHTFVITLITCEIIHLGMLSLYVVFQFTLDFKLIVAFIAQENSLETIVFTVMFVETDLGLGQS